MSFSTHLPHALGGSAIGSVPIIQGTDKAAPLPHTSLPPHPELEQLTWRVPLEGSLPGADFRPVSPDTNGQ